MNDWSRFGRGDLRGALNFIEPSMIAAACHAVKKGETIPLNAPVAGLASNPVGRPTARRTVRQHNQLRPLGDGRFVVVNDDNIEIALQGSSQWDSFAHFGLIEEGDDDVFYGGAGLDETFPDPSARSLGIDSFGGAIAGRGVFIDVVATVAGPEADTLPTGIPIDRALIEKTLERQQTSLGRGDIVVVYTGFFGSVRDKGGLVPQVVSGLTADTLSLWEETEIAGLACDNLGVDFLDYGREGSMTDYAIHIGALRNLGIPLGELWELDALAVACRADARYDFLLVSAPLNIPGAFGTPANVVAIR